jgi:ribosomal-protein-alanine N-acetyltransferase
MRRAIHSRRSRHEEQRLIVNNHQPVEPAVYYLEPMRIDDVPEVSRVERRCFTNPWPESAYRRELKNPASNYYVILRLHTPQAAPRMEERESPSRRFFLPLIRRPEPIANDPIVGFAGMWLLYDETHVTTIAVAPEHRGRGLGELLLIALFEEAINRGAEWLTLEVRVSNGPAQTLYEKYGFTRQGVRRRYYSDNGEDAYIMWSPSLRNEQFQRQFAELRSRLIGRLESKAMINSRNVHDRPRY